jgi:hypothetical protein
MHVFFLSFLLCASVVLAHNVTYHALEGVTLCLEPRSVQLDLNPAARETEKAMLERLRTSLHSTLVNYQVPFVEKEKCGDADSFVYTALYVSLDNDPSYILAATTQVGSPSEMSVLESKTNQRRVLNAKN